MELTLQYKDIILRGGHVIMVHKLPPYGLADIPAPVIRRLTHCYYNHVAIIGDCLGELWVFEAVGKGFVPTKPLREYLTETGTKREIAILEPWRDRPTQEIYGNIRNIVNKGYDFKSLLWYQIIYQISGRWKGKKNEAAEGSIYCSEAIAEAFPDIFSEPWLISPDKIVYNENFNIIYESNKPARVVFNKKYPYNCV